MQPLLRKHPAGGGLPPFVAIEGNSGVGKSATAQALAEQINSVWFPQPAKYLDQARGETVPPFPGRDIQTAIEASSVWPDAELRRQDHRLAAAAVRPGVQVVDTTPVSVLGFELAKAHFGYAHATHQVARSYLSLLESDLLQEPIFWIFLTAPSDVIRQRLYTRGSARSFLTRVETIEYLDGVRTEFYQNFISASRYLLIDNSAIAVDDVVNRISAEFELPAGEPPLHPMRDFFRSVQPDTDFCT
jgi:hypothetical protein